MAQVDGCRVLDESELRQWVLRRLGGGIHRIELCEAHLDAS